mgnify:CR=1 FL=1
MVEKQQIEDLLRAPKILIANGVNLDLLGSREPHIYGTNSLKDLEKIVLEECKTISGKVVPYLEFFQTNSEEKYLEAISGDWDGLVLNPGAWTHYSLALSDRLRALKTPYVEVHITNIYSREPIRNVSLISEGSIGSICGFGLHSYVMGVKALLSNINGASSA